MKLQAGNPDRGGEAVETKAEAWAWTAPREQLDAWLSDRLNHSGAPVRVGCGVCGRTLGQLTPQLGTRGCGVEVASGRNRLAGGDLGLPGPRPWSAHDDYADFDGRGSDTMLDAWEAEIQAGRMVGVADGAGRRWRWRCHRKCGADHVVTGNRMSRAYVAAVLAGSPSLLLGVDV